MIDFPHQIKQVNAQNQNILLNIYVYFESEHYIYIYNINNMWITGEFQLPLNSVDLAGPVEEWKDLAAVDDGSNQYLGDLCLSLRYVPSSGKLTGKYKKDY